MFVCTGPPYTNLKAVLISPKGCNELLGTVFYGLLGLLCQGKEDVVLLK